MSSRTTIFFILLLSSIFSCGLRHQEIKRISSFHYSFDYLDSIKWLSGIDVYSYHIAPNWRNDFQFNKTIQFDKDSNLRGINISYYNLSGEGEYFEFTLIREEGGDEESINIDHSYLDTIINSWISVQYEQVGGVVEVQYTSDSLEYTRSLIPSKELVNHYRNFALLNADSIIFTDKLPRPDISNCTYLLSSAHEITECLSKEDNYYRLTWIDSNLVKGVIEVEKETHEYYYSENLNELGINVIKEWNNNSYYTEKHISHDNYFPVYQRIVRFNSMTNDTIYQMEMNSAKIGSKRVYSFNIFDRNPISSRSNDQKIPIIHKEIKIWTTKYGQVIRFHSIGYTEKGHRLEYAYEGLLEKRKVTIDHRVIPEISGKQLYDLQSEHIIYGEWLYYIPKQKWKNKRSALQRPSPILPFVFKANSITVEKNRKENYEKIVSPDSLSFYNVYYYGERRKKR